MSGQKHRINRRGLPLALIALAGLWGCLAPGQTADAQVQGGYVGFGVMRSFVIGFVPVVGNGAVGGVSIDAQGVLDRSTLDLIGDLARERQAAMSDAVPSQIAQASQLRKVSLRRLEQAIYEKRKADEPIDEEMLMLAGLQSVQFIFIYPEENDVVIAGPAEGWTVDDFGTVVGAGTNAPVLQLEDLVVALRSAQEASQTGVTCSIDPSAEGVARLQDFFSSGPQVNNASLRRMEQLLGPQAVTLSGVPADSHFARVMVAADFLMKRVAMGLEKSPDRRVPSYMQMLGGPRTMPPKDAMPRWWLAPDYAAPKRDAEGLAFAFPSSGVRVMTEDSYLNEDGNFEPSKDAHPTAIAWAKRFTEYYEQIANKMPVFAELRNLMDLSLVAAIVHQPELQAKIGHNFPLFANAEVLPTASYNVPERVASQATFVRKSGQFIISISGGADISPGLVLESATVDSTVLENRNDAAPGEAKNWWWD